jgi:O-acetyl-ADP-ribose deacetylase (regulator of RNase III)
MILYVSGNLSQSPAQVLVNTVNTVGVMGKGIALEFKRLYPDMFKEYQRRCEGGDLDIGKLFLYKTPHKWILNFPTKRHWREASRVEYIERGLEEFRRVYSQSGIHSIAFPPLGCGNGRLDFKTQVQPIMHRRLSVLPIDVFIYPVQRDDLIAEHEQPNQMQQWLRSEPEFAVLGSLG